MKVIKQPTGKNPLRDSQLTKLVADILDRVQNEGDAALYDYAEKFDRIKLDSIRVDGISRTAEGNGVVSCGSKGGYSY